VNDGGGDFREGVTGVHCKGQLNQTLSSLRKERPAAGKALDNEATNVLAEPAKSSRGVKGNQVEGPGQTVENVTTVDVGAGVGQPHP